MNTNAVTQPLFTTQSNQEILAPAIYATSPAGGLSPKYSFFSTVQIVESLKNQGFQIVTAAQARGRINSAHSKHWLRFHHENLKDFKSTDGHTYLPEVTVVNSHDGTNSLRVYASLVLNGMSSASLVLPVGRFGGTRLIHRGLTIDMVLAAVEMVVEGQESLAEAVMKMNSVVLTEEQKKTFVAKVIEFKEWDSRITPEQFQSQVLGVENLTLWTALAMTYDKLLSGGISGLPGPSRKFKTRAIRSAAKKIVTGQGLWLIAESMMGAAK